MARGQLRMEEFDEDPETPADQYAEGLAAMGLQAEESLDDTDEVFELWPDNVETFRFWRSVQTQWRRSSDGRREGLDYPGVKVCMHMHGIPKKQQPVMFQELQVMEVAALNEWNSQT